MRWKIILPNFIVVLAIGLAGWLYLESYYTDYLENRAEEKLERDRNLFVAVNQLNAVKFLRTVMARSRDAEVEGIFADVTAEEMAAVQGDSGSGGGGDEEDGEGEGEEGEGEVSTTEERDIRQYVLVSRAHTECQAFRANLSQELSGGRAPEIIAIINRDGIVISRDVNPNAEPVGENFAEQYSSVRRALQGNAVRDIWQWRDYFLDVSIAPIHHRGSVVGALLVGRDVSNGVAQADSELFGEEVVYLVQDDDQWRVHSSSIADGDRRQSLVTEIAGKQQEIAASMAAGETLSFVSIDVAGEEHIGLAGMLSSNDSAVPAAYMLLSSTETISAPANQAVYVFFFALGGLVIVVLLGFVLGSHFLKPIEEIEDGVLRIINGDTEHRFEVDSAELGGLAYRVNQLVSVLTGEEEESEDDIDN